MQRASTSALVNLQSQCHTCGKFKATHKKLSPEAETNQNEISRDSAKEG